MARRRPAFKRSSNKQYGWACATNRSIVALNTITTTVLVAGDADVEVRAIGGTHCNLKRIIGDIIWHPWIVDATTTIGSTAVISNLDLVWAILAVDNDDDPSQYAPDNATALSEERILAHGLLDASMYRHNGGANNDTPSWIHIGETKAHIDVKSNRRIRSDDDIVLNMILRGTVPIADLYEESGFNCVFRSLLKFPG